jgi:hypothetical protein
MIEAAVKNKYGFNMQVSVSAMAAPDRGIAAPIARHLWACDT